MGFFFEGKKVYKRSVCVGGSVRWVVDRCVCVCVCVCVCLCVCVCVCAWG